MLEPMSQALKKRVDGKELLQKRMDSSYPRLLPGLEHQSLIPEIREE